MNINQMNKYKNILISVLIIYIVGVYVFRGSGLDDTYNEELNNIKFQNETLIKSNDSIMLLNSNLDKRMRVLDSVIKFKEKSLEIANTKIRQLEDGKIKVNNFVDGLDIDGVDSALTDYLEGRQD